MENKFKNLSFSDFVTVDYAQLDDELAAYRRKRLKNGAMHEQVEEEEVDEALSHSQRNKVSQRMKRMSKRIAIAKKRAMKKAPSMDVLKKRAKKQAKNAMIKKWTRGMDKSELSFGRRAELERKLKKMDVKLTNMAKRKMPEIRKMDRERRANANKSK
jgi:hypothetical protein